MLVLAVQPLKGIYRLLLRSLRRIYNVGHQFTGYTTLPAIRVDAFLSLYSLINPLSFNQLLFPLP
jgi:hypothetical protein